VNLICTVGEHDYPFGGKENIEKKIITNNYDFHFLFALLAFSGTCFDSINEAKEKVLKDNSHTSSILDLDVSCVPSVSITIPESDVGTLFCWEECF
jgi:hypothetical protein